MPDLFEEQSSTEEFVLPGDEELLAGIQPAAEAEAAAPEAPQEAHQLRDEHGRFAARQPEGEPEGEAPAAEAPPAEDDPIERLVNEKYGGDHRKALEALQESQSLIGRQGSELEELRARDQQWQDYLLEQQQAQQRAQSFQQQPDWAALIEENPAAATQLAAQQGNEWAYQQAAAAWEEISPGAPMMWYKTQQIEGQLQEFAEERRAKDGQSALNSLLTKYPDLQQYEDEMIKIVLPHERAALASNDINYVASAVESLYLRARGLNSDTLAQTAQQLARKGAEAEQRTREEAFVASATRTNAEPPPSLEEEMSAGWGEEEKRLNEGWHIG